MMWGVPGIGGHLTTPFITLELSATIKLQKGGNAQGPDNIPPEFMMHCGKCWNGCANSTSFVLSTQLSRRFGVEPLLWSS